MIESGSGFQFAARRASSSACCCNESKEFAEEGSITLGKAESFSVILLSNQANAPDVCWLSAVRSESARERHVASRKATAWPVSQERAPVPGASCQCFGSLTD